MRPYFGATYFRSYFTIGTAFADPDGSASLKIENGRGEQSPVIGTFRSRHVGIHVFPCLRPSQALVESGHRDKARWPSSLTEGEDDLLGLLEGDAGPWKGAKALRTKDLPVS